MSEYDAKEIRKERAARAHRMADAPSPRKVDASSVAPERDLLADAQTGMRPVSKRQYKHGGHVHGQAAHAHGGRKPRKHGGGIDEYINRDVREANHEIAHPHTGGFKRGGRKHRDAGGSANPVPTTALNLNNRNVGAATTGGAGAGRKRGGHVEHESKADERADKKLIHETVDPSCIRKGHAKGGEPKHWIKDAIKHPGALHKATHTPMGEHIPEKKLEKAEHSKNPKVRQRAHLAETLEHMGHKRGGKADGEYQGTRPTGGREARKAGGRAKGKTNIVISINPHPHDQGQPGGAAMQRPPAPPLTPPMPPGPPPGAMGPPPGAMGPPPGAGGAPPGMPPGLPPGLGAGPHMGPPMGPPNGLPPGIPRKRGGRTFPDMEYGAGGGEGRLEKIKRYGLKAP